LLLNLLQSNYDISQQRIHTIENIINKNMYLNNNHKWSQKINCGNIEYEQKVYNCLLKICSFCVLLNSNSSSGNEKSNETETSTTINDESVIRELSHTIIQLISEISSELNNKYLSSIVKNNNCSEYPLRPAWIHMISFTSIYLCSIVPIILNCSAKLVLGNVSASSKKKSKKGANEKANESISQTCFKEVSNSCKLLLGMFYYYSFTTTTSI
jgi:hypothetical protein